MNQKETVNVIEALADRLNDDWQRDRNPWQFERNYPVGNALFRGAISIDEEIEDRDVWRLEVWLLLPGAETDPQLAGIDEPNQELMLRREIETQ